MSFAQFPIDELIAVGVELARFEAELVAPRKAAEDVGGLGSQQQAAIRYAIDDFHGDWAASVAHLVENIGVFGECTRGIAAAAHRADEAGAELFGREDFGDPLRAYGKSPLAKAGIDRIGGVHHSLWDEAAMDAVRGAGTGATVVGIPAAVAGGAVGTVLGISLLVGAPVLGTVAAAEYGALGAGVGAGVGAVVGLAEGARKLAALETS
ncbi:hypothetical protein [Nocardia huaxiensis]|uniref:hypothetical protein n=1 Tax=Nocardia huaxiensis TaxID=2755382 RepID=UPI001E5D8353|nr:hypothetical protein [Nocardia huaxiensis]UFS93409.1 hypothetical protein LPY97_21510 [Nocardia huaxiensis]